MNTEKKVDEKFWSDIKKHVEGIVKADKLKDKTMTDITNAFSREDLKRNRGSICIHFLEMKGEAAIMDWIAFQELKKELIGDRRCMKNQTAEEREIMAKGLRIDNNIKNRYKKLYSQCYHRTERTIEEKAERLYKKIISKAYPDKK